GRPAFLRQSLSLAYSEPVLLVRHDQRQISVFYLLLDQGMGSYYDRGTSILDGLVNYSLLGRCHGTGKKGRFQGDGILFEHSRYIFKMLSGKHLGRRHHCPLAAVEVCQKKSQKSYHCLSGSHIPLDQPGHNG